MPSGGASWARADWPNASINPSTEPANNLQQERVICESLTTWWDFLLGGSRIRQVNVDWGVTCAASNRCVETMQAACGLADDCGGPPSHKRLGIYHLRSIPKFSPCAQKSVCRN